MARRDSAVPAPPPATKIGALSASFAVPAPIGTPRVSQVGGQRAACRGVEGHLARLAPLALTHPHNPPALAQVHVAAPQGGHLAHAQARLEQELDEGVVAPGQPVAGLTGDAQEGVDGGLGQAGRLSAATVHAHRAGLRGGVGVEKPGLPGPAAEPAQAVQLAVDARRPQAGDVDEVLTVVDQVGAGEDIEPEQRPAEGALVPAQEHAHVVGVAPHGGGGQVGPTQTLAEARQPLGRDPGIGQHGATAPSCTQGHPCR